MTITILEDCVLGYRIKFEDTRRITSEEIDNALFNSGFISYETDEGERFTHIPWSWRYYHSHEA